MTNLQAARPIVNRNRQCTIVNSIVNRQSSIVNGTVAYKGEHAAVGRPRRNVDGPLAAVHVGDHAWRAAGYRKQSQIDALIVWMVRRRHFFRKTDERNPLAVRR